MRWLILSAALLMAGPAAATTIIDFEDGDLYGGGYIHSNGRDYLVTLPDPAHGNVVYAEVFPNMTGEYVDFAGVSFSRIDGDIQRDLVSFDIYAFRDTVLQLEAGTGFSMPIAGGSWVHINLPSLGVIGAQNRIRAHGGFYVDNVEYSTSPYVSGAPEPASWLMMIAGFGLIGTAVRAKRRIVAGA